MTVKKILILFLHKFPCGLILQKSSECRISLEYYSIKLGKKFPEETVVLEFLKVLLTMFHFYTPLKHKTRGFLLVLGSIKYTQYSISVPPENFRKLEVFTINAVYLLVPKPAFFCKIFTFFVQKGTFTQSNSARAV